MPNRLRLASLAFAASALLAPALSHAAGDAGACRYVPVAKLPLLPGHPWRPLVEGSIDGKPATLLFDTGAYTTQLTRTATDRLGITVQATGKYAIGVGGASVVYTAKLDDFAIGPVHSGRIDLAVIGNSAQPFKFDGLVGADSMRSMDLEIALAQHFVQFFRASSCGDTWLAYWDQDAMEIPFGGTERAPNKPHFIVELNGHKLEAMIDSGSPRTHVARAAAERLGIKVGSAQAASDGFASGIGDEKVAHWKATFDTFGIGTETIKNAELGILDESSTGAPMGADVVLGVDFLRAHRVLVAMSQQKLYVSYVGGDVFGPAH